MRYHTMKVHACDNEPSMGIHTLYSVSTRKREEGRKEETEEGRKEQREGQGEGGKRMEVKKGRREGEEDKEKEGEKRGIQVLEAQTHLALLLVVSHLQRQDPSHASVCET